MKYEETHKFLEVKQREMTKNRHLYNEQAIEINGLAILALEKQIPKKPILDIIYPSGIKSYKCPVCKKGCLVRTDLYYPKYCSNCGQELNWSDAE